MFGRSPRSDEKSENRQRDPDFFDEVHRAKVLPLTVVPAQPWGTGPPL